MRLLFSRGPWLGPRFLILVLLSVGLMLWDHYRPAHTSTLRNHLSIIATPLLYIANAPGALFDGIAKNFQSRQSLVEQNTLQRAQLLILQGELQKLQALQAENQELRGLLQSSPVINHVRLLVADVLAIHASPFQQQILLNKGSADGVFVGQAVLDAQGIMGQVIEVTPYTSRVLLLTDPQSGIPIQDNRTGARGILLGQGAQLVWMDVVPTADIRVGDVLTSSGLGGRYPVGYPVGTVSIINRHTVDQFMQVIVTPSARMNSAEQVLLVWPENTH